MNLKDRPLATAISLWMLTLPVHAAAALTDVQLLSADLPQACRAVEGVFPAGEKTATFYRYDTYKGVLPPLVGKAHQSFTCGDKTGSIFYFEYANAAQREQAEMFALPVLSADRGAGKAPDVRHAGTTLVVVSFKEAPNDLLVALDKRIGMAGADAVVAKPANAPGPVTPSAVPMPSSTVPQAPSVPSGAPVETSGTSLSVSGSGGSDLSDEVLQSFANGLDCKNPQLSEQPRAACRSLEDFRQGDRPTNAPASAVPFLGQSYTVDEYGRFESARHDVMIANGPELSFFSVTPASALEDYELKTLIDAKASKGELPKNSIADQISGEAPQHRVSVASTGGKSLVFTDSRSRKVYLRRSGDRWVMVSPTGGSTGEQILSSITLTELQ